MVVKIGGAGACHSDLHLMHDFEPGMVPWRMPFTLGHENAGWVDSVGDGVSTVAEGDAVAVYGPWGCGACERCRLGLEGYCENQAAAPVVSGGGGLGLDGRMAEVPAGSPRASAGTDEAPQAYRDLKEGKVQGRAVVVA